MARMARMKNEFGGKTLNYGGDSQNWHIGEKFAGFYVGDKFVTIQSTGKERRIFQFVGAGRVDDTVNGIGKRGETYDVFSTGLLTSIIDKQIPALLKENGFSGKELYDFLIILRYDGMAQIKGSPFKSHKFNFEIDSDITRDKVLRASPWKEEEKEKNEPHNDSEEWNQEGYDKKDQLEQDGW